MAGSDQNKSKPNDVTVPPPAYSVAASYPPVEQEEVIHAGKRVGKYLIRRMIGRGGMGTVYEAMDVPLQRKVALKILPREFSQNDEALQRFIREARLAAKLNHPNVVTVYDVGRKGTIYYIAMELVEGTSGQELLESGKTIDWREAARSIADVCRALAAAHDAGLIHRDIKPGNILWSQTGDVKLSDFGLAKPTQADDLSITRRDAFVGTPLFMSPEQCRNDAVDHRSDIYSLGATFYTLLTGQAPFNQGSAIQILFAHCSAPIPDVRESLPDSPSMATYIIQKALAKSPGDRYQSAREMRADLDALLGGVDAPQGSLGELEALGSGDVVPGPASGIFDAPRPSSNNKRYLILGGIAAILIVAISIVIGLMSMQHGDPKTTIAQTPNAATPIATAPDPIPPANFVASPKPALPVVVAPKTVPTPATIPSATVEALPTPPLEPVADAIQNQTPPTTGPTVTLMAPEPLNLVSLVPEEPQAKQPNDRGAHNRPNGETREDGTRRPPPPREDDDEKTSGMTASDMRDPLLRQYARVKRFATGALLEPEKKEQSQATAQILILWADAFKNAHLPLHRKFAEDARIMAERLQPGIGKIQPRVRPQDDSNLPLPPEDMNAPPGERPNDGRPNDGPGSADRPQPPEGQGPGGGGPRRPQGPRRNN